MQQTFNSLNEIEDYKAQIRTDIREDEQKIATMWKSLFHKDDERIVKTPVQQFSSFMNIGVGVLDGAILGWKLYRKFKGSSFGKRRRR